MKATRYQDLLNEQLGDPNFRREYEALEEEFTLATEIIALRKGLNLTQKELAERVGTSQLAIARVIANHTGDMMIPMTGPGFHWGLGVATYHGRHRFPLIRSVGTYGWGGSAPGLSGAALRAVPTREH